MRSRNAPGWFQAWITSMEQFLNQFGLLGYEAMGV
ncbi:hypothetical protein EV286_1166 [Rhizobium sp. BK251]|nr:hypothetical protein EV286_1166 [Rhizobium sp. BK251]